MRQIPTVTSHEIRDSGTPLFCLRWTIRSA
jgi:hypothetical protein